VAGLRLRDRKAKQMNPYRWAVTHTAPPTLQKRIEVAEALRSLTAFRDGEVQPRPDAARVARELEALQRDCELLDQAFYAACREAALIIAQSRARKLARARAAAMREAATAEGAGFDAALTLVKARVDDPEHPGWPAHTPGGLGGKFRPKDGGKEATASLIHLAGDLYYPPPPPGYDPNTWKHGQWPNGRHYLKDSDGNTYTAHPEDEGHWRHWDKRDGDNNDQGRWPPDSKKLKPNQSKPKSDQSLSDPSGDSPPWKPPLILPIIPVDPIISIPEFIPSPIFVPP
jgi:hypothetical protein